MQFSQEEIKKGIVIVFRGQSQIAHSASEAEDVINSFHLHNANLIVNDYAKTFLSRLFIGEKTADKLKTTRCSIYPIRFYPALADTIEEHEKIYKWDGAFTEVSFLGMRLDSGFYSLNAWEMEQLAESINNSEDFPVREVQEAIRKNGWTDDTGTPYGICHSNDASLELDENAKAFVRQLR